MAGYRTIDGDQVEQVLAAYDLGALETFSAIEGGCANSSFLVEAAGDRYVLTLFDSKTPAEVATLANLLAHLGANGFPTSPILRTRDGELLYQGLAAPCVVKGYLAGSVVAPLADTVLEAVGAGLARLHQIEPPADLPRSHAYGHGSFDLEACAAVSPEFSAWLAAKASRFRDMIDPDLPRALIHGDLFWDNVIIGQDGSVAFIDFEEACLEHRALDLGMCAVGCCVDAGGIARDKVQHLLSGYEGTTPLQAGERRALKLFVEYGAVATAYWRFHNYLVVKKSPEQPRHYQEMQALADSVAALPHGWPFHQTPPGSNEGPTQPKM